MATRIGLTLAACIALAGMGATPLPGIAQAPFDTSAGNLLVVLRESRGENKQDEALRPFGKVRARLPDGRAVEFTASWFQFLGDMHVRVVFDGERNMQSASTEDLERLHLDAEEAMRVGLRNLKRRYGSPVETAWDGGLTLVESATGEMASSYFLDRDYWEHLQARYPDGVVVGAPRRGGLVYAPAADAEAVATLRFSSIALYSGGAGARLSSGLYLFKDSHWSVFQAPLAAR